MSDQNSATASLETLIEDYVRAGWTVILRTGNSARLMKGNQAVQLTLDAQGKVSIDGPALPLFSFAGRAQAWLVLLLMFGIIFGLAWFLGYFRF